MALARILAMAFGAIGSIYAARCLGPRNLGISGMVLNISTQASLFLSIIYPTVLVREYKNVQTDEEKNQLIKIATTFRLVGALIFCVLCVICMIFHLTPNDYHFAGWFFIPILLLSTIQPIWVFQAAEKLHFQSIISVLQPAMTTGLYLLFFHPGMSAGADLAVGTTITAILTVIYWKAIYKLTPMKGKFIVFREFHNAWNLILKSRWLFISSIAIYIYTTFEQPLLGWLYFRGIGKIQNSYNYN